MITRRQLLSRSAAAALVVGFDPLNGAWVDAATAHCAPFVAVPPLDGTLHLDLATRQADSTDTGNIVAQLPCAVLRPGSVRDIQTMIRYCRQHGILVATRGQGHTTHGQGLVGGLLIENRSLRKIHSIGPEGADVDAGVLWKELAVAAYEQRLTPPVLTGYVGLSIAGTLSVGGVDGNTGTYDEGLQIDHVSELEVVTGDGRIRTCSAEHHRDLFEVMLGGLGQCGVITRAKVDLVRAPEMVRSFRPHYIDNATFFRDLRTLLGRGELDGIFNLWMPFGTSLTYQINAQALFDRSQPPDNAHLFRDLSIPAAAVPYVDTPYLDFIQFVDLLVDGYRATMGWDRLIKPWFDVWLSDRTVEQYTADVIATLAPDDIGPGGFFLLIPQRRSKMSRRFSRVADADASDFIYLFDLLTASLLPGPNPAFTARMLDRNRRLYEKARDLGGTRYPISAIEFSHADWQHHYGPVWPELVRLKQRFDPDGVLTPGPGIF